MVTKWKFQHSAGLAQQWRKRFYASLRHCLFPNLCLLCRCHCDGDTGLCSACSRDLPWLGECCRRCSLPLSSQTASRIMSAMATHRVERLCGRCQHKPPPFHRAHCLFEYDYPIDQIISAFKFNGRLDYGRVLATLLAQRLCDHYRGQENTQPGMGLKSKPGLVLAVPLHPSRQRQRGFNQAQEIAGVVAKALQLPLAHDLCVRVKKTEHQLGLSATQRRRNLRHAFVTAKLPARHVLLIDDVLTTGTTVAAVTDSLHDAGAQVVEVACLARTPI